MYIYIYIHYIHRLYIYIYINVVYVHERGPPHLVRGQQVVKKMLSTGGLQSRRIESRTVAVLSSQGFYWSSIGVLLKLFGELWVCKESDFEET